MDLDVLIAHEGIRKAMADYVFHADNGRTREFGALFGAAGEFVLPDGSSHRGAEAITALLDGHAAFFRGHPEKAPPGYLRHQITTVGIELTGARTATAESYFLGLTRNRVDHWGTWSDRFERAGDGRWLFARRVVTTDGYDPAGWFATAFSRM